ncbi:MAG: DUF4272 domain-containing protein, partial [Anaerolineae bacterium]|nr:DUF4272 domain-containing protein [Anaerolineae bacterium]
ISKRADGQSLADYNEKIAQYQLQAAVTEDEREFATDDDPPEYIRIKFSQRLESCWTLLWALKLTNNLKRPDTFCNPIDAADIIESRSPTQFLLDAKLRSKMKFLMRQICIIATIGQLLMLIYTTKSRHEA